MKNKTSRLQKDQFQMITNFQSTTGVVFVIPNVAAIIDMWLPVDRYQIQDAVKFEYCELSNESERNKYGTLK